MSNKWDELFEQASEQLTDWRENKPKATFRNIEDTVDEQFAKLRAQIIQDLVEQNELTNMEQVPKVERPLCPDCQKPLNANGKKKRELITNHEQSIQIERTQAICPECKGTFFPSG